MNIFSALPLMFMDIDFPFPVEDMHPREFAREYFLYENDADKIMFWARMPTVILALVLGLFVFLWAKKLYGSKAGFFALFLYILSPNILAHSRLTTQDFGVTLFMFVSLFAFWLFLRKPSKKMFFLVSILVGLSLSTKVTSILLFPVFFLFLILSKKKVVFEFFRRKNLLGRSLNAFVLLFFMALIGFFIVFLVHSLEVHPVYNQDDPYYSPEWRSDERLDLIVEGLPLGDKLGGVYKFFVTEIPVPGPHYFQGLYTQWVISQGGTKSFLMGEFSDKGFWNYFLIAFLIKTPIAMLLFLLFSIVLFNKTRSRKIMDELFLIVPFLFVFLFFSAGNFHVGLRHILFIYPVMFVFASKIVNFRRKWFYLLIGVLCVGYAVSSFMIYPHYLEYFNEFVGPEDGYAYLLDSNLDWGQDFKLLAGYVNDNGISHIWLKTYSFDSPSYRGINATELECNQRVEGLVAVDANALQGLIPEERGCYSWLKEYEPVDRVAYTFFIYDIEKS